MRIEETVNTTSTISSPGATNAADTPGNDFSDVLAIKRGELESTSASEFLADKLGIGDSAQDSARKTSAQEAAAQLADMGNTKFSASIEAFYKELGALQPEIPGSAHNRGNNADRINEANRNQTGNSDRNTGALRCNDVLNQYFQEASEKYDIDIRFLKAVAKTESNFNPDATSKAGAMGVMQLMPSAAKDYGAADPYDARQNILAGAKILSTFLKRYDGDKELTLAAYNSGPGTVKKHGGVPSFTRKYIDRVMNFYNS